MAHKQLTLPVIGITCANCATTIERAGGASLTTALLRLMAVLLVACPYALGLATRTAIVVGMGRGAGLGILFKNSAALELAHKLHPIVLDKTGTITKAEPAVTDMIVNDELLMVNGERKIRYSPFTRPPEFVPNAQLEVLRLAASGGQDLALL